MLSKTSRVIILVLSIFLITFTNSLAFHKNNSPTLSKTNWKGEKETKKEFEILEKRLSCANSAKADVIKGEPKFDEKTGKDLLDENGKKIYEDDQYVIEIKGWHRESPIKADGKLQPNRVNLNFDLDYANLKLVDLLLTYCIQDETKDRPAKFKGSYLEELYLEIALDNNYVDKDSNGNVKPNYNKKIFDNPLGADILKPENGIIIKNPNVVWYVPDYLIDKYRENEKQKEELEKKAKIEAEKKKKKGRGKKKKKSYKRC